MKSLQRYSHWRRSYSNQHSMSTKPKQRWASNNRVLLLFLSQQEQFINQSTTLRMTDKLKEGSTNYHLYVMHLTTKQREKVTSSFLSTVITFYKTPYYTRALKIYWVNLSISTQNGRNLCKIKWEERNSCSWNPQKLTLCKHSLMATVHPKHLVELIISAKFHSLLIVMSSEGQNKSNWRRLINQILKKSLIALCSSCSLGKFQVAQK